MRNHIWISPVQHEAANAESAPMLQSLAETSSTPICALLPADGYYPSCCSFDFFEKQLSFSLLCTAFNLQFHFFFPRREYTGDFKESLHWWDFEPHYL